MAVSEGASREMEALCSDLHLPAPGEARAMGSRGVASTGLAGTPPLTASQDLLLAEASIPGEGAHAEGSNVEIFIEAVAGNVTLSNTGNAAGMGYRSAVWAPWHSERNLAKAPVPSSWHPRDATVPSCL